MPGAGGGRRRCWLLALLLAAGAAACFCAPALAVASPRLLSHHGPSPAPSVAGPAGGWPVSYVAADGGEGGAASAVALCTDHPSSSATPTNAALCRPPKAVVEAAAAAGLPEALATYVAAAMEVGEAVMAIITSLSERTGVYLPLQDCTQTNGQDLPLAWLRRLVPARQS